MKAVLFCRVSSKEQEETGYSLDSQERLLRSYTERKSYSVGKLFAISESAGSSKQREIFKTMVAYVQKENIKIIICEKVDRLTRNFKDAVWIDEWLEKDSEREVHLVKDSLILHRGSRSQEKLNWGIRILFAKNYIDNLSEEVRKGYKEKVEQGWMPHVPPIGYKTVGDKGKRIHVIDPDKANYIKRIFSFYVLGNYSVEKLCDVMSKEGLRSTRGGKIVKPKMHALLTNPFYTGKFRWGDKIYQGKHEPIISDEVFEKVQSILKGKSAYKTTARNFQFKGLMKCLGCGGIISWEEHKSFVYGHCNHYRKCDQKKWSKEPDVESQLKKSFIDLKLNNPKIADWVLKALKDSHKDEIEYHASKQNELQKSLEKIQNRMETLYDDKLDGVINVDFYSRKAETLTQEKERLLKEIRNLSKTNSNYYQNSIDIYGLSQNAYKTYLEAKDLDTKRRLLKLMFENLYLDEGKLLFKYTRPFELLQKAVCTTNSSKLSAKSFVMLNIFELPKKSENVGLLPHLVTTRNLVRDRRDSNSQPLP